MVDTRESTNIALSIQGDSGGKETRKANNNGITATEWFAATVPGKRTALSAIVKNSYLSFPALASSNRIEWLFSSAFYILDEKRNRLSCNMAVVLIFDKNYIRLTER